MNDYKMQFKKNRYGNKIFFTQNTLILFLQIKSFK